MGEATSPISHYLQFPINEITKELQRLEMIFFLS